MPVAVAQPSAQFPVLGLGLGKLALQPHDLVGGGQGHALVDLPRRLARYAPTVEEPLVS